MTLSVRAIHRPLGLAIGPLSVGVAEHEGHFYADVPPLGRISASSLEELASSLQAGLADFQKRARALEVEEMEKALATAHQNRQRSLAQLREAATVAAARAHRLAATRYALLVLVLMPLLNQHAPAWRLGR
ncbi:hypothetical protein [Stenotrophomonas sp. Marseille-Q4652]|uniref:hypothetical protein n=1 Tax=Stenotrophomonas sp. Marseille-Q4652 TaxID=2866595 RepID=UPI001CE406B9|nr:hypothetical protein [Stenotrophomonas sp. Marseille-Q4652]